MPAVEVLRTNDPVELSWAEATLKGEGIDCVVLDRHTSAIEGSIGAIPRRLAVGTADAGRARAALAEARARLPAEGDQADGDDDPA